MGFIRWLRALGYGCLALVLAALSPADFARAGDAAGPAAPGGGGEVLTISEGLSIATEENRILKIASRETDMAGQDTIIARSRMLPKVDASLDETFLANQPGAHFGSFQALTAEKSSLSYEVAVRQTLYDFGANRYSYDASLNSLEAQRLNVELLRNRVALDFVIAYLDLLEAEKRIDVADKEVQRLQSHLADATSFYEEGVITKNDLLEAQVRLSDARQRLLTARNGRDIVESRINSIMARPLRTPVRVEDVREINPVLVELEEAWRTAEEQRLELQVLSRELRIAELDEARSRAGYFPEFFARGAYTYTENRYQLHEDNWSLLLGVNLNVFRGGSVKAEVQKALYRQERLGELRAKLIDDVRVEVETSYLDSENATEKVAVTKDAVSQADENLRIHRIRYEEGVGTATDVLDAVTLLRIAETNYDSALYDLKRARARLMFAMGIDLLSAYAQ